MRVVISNRSGVPLYEQIVEQVTAAILAGEVAEGDALPSVRALARDLRISVITTTRAYSELEAAGYIANVPGKGAYVLPVDSALIRERLLRQAEEGLGVAIDAARLAGLSRDELVELLDALLAAGPLVSARSASPGSRIATDGSPDRTDATPRTPEDHR